MITYYCNYLKKKIFIDNKVFFFFLTTRASAGIRRQADIRKINKQKKYLDG